MYLFTPFDSYVIMFVLSLPVYSDVPIMTYPSVEYPLSRLAGHGLFLLWTDTQHPKGLKRYATALAFWLKLLVLGYAL